MKSFSDSDITTSGGYERIAADRADLIEAPTEWQKAGLQETASGYGSRLNSGLKINFNGRLYRLYATIWSNSGTLWFRSRGRKIIVS